jgi:DNA polymerase-3 subunit gamma/tau
MALVRTTCARILARKINQPGYDPNEDFAFNVFELDAASNNSVDDIRSLIDQVTHSSTNRKIQSLHYR